MPEPEPEFRSSEICDVGGELFEIDRELTDLVNSGTPAVVTGCRHERQVIKQGRLFMVTDRDGGIYSGCKCGMGLYREDTRFLSGMKFRIEGEPASLLSGSTERTNLAHIEFMNAPFFLADGQEVRQETLHISVIRALADVMREQIHLVNFNPFPVSLRLAMDYYSDFADIFEVRGLHRQGHGTFFRPKLTESGVAFGYRGGDDLVRSTRITFSERPHQLYPLPCEHGGVGATAEWQLELPPNGGRVIIETRVELVEGQATPEASTSFETFVQRVETLANVRDFFATRIVSDHEVFNLVLDRSVRDLVALTSTYSTGPFLAAGIPWFTCPFGRDALLTAMQVLVLDANLAKGVLRFLASHQGKAEDPYRDEQPGKILHEYRFGELSRMGVIPHTPYYGTIDATPLWLILLSETYRWTGDSDLVHELWDHVEAALLWLETYGDLDEDGFIEYMCRSSKGIRNQGWKDAFNSIIFPDGRLADAPIALVEVQGYVYAAKRRAAELCQVVGQQLLAKRLLREASDLKEAFNATFWSDAHGYYALALDRDKRAVWTPTSNPGQALWADIVAPEHVEAVVRHMIGPGMFSGWGIRTISAASPVFNPIGYHNGTVWPHDNSFIAKGMADHGYKAEANLIFNAMYDCAVRFPYYRLPELFCGFQRQGELDVPIPYPVACSPQAWAAGTPIFLLQAALGLQADAAHKTLRIVNPTLPRWLDRITIHNLRVGRASLDVEFLQSEGVTTTRIRNKQGELVVLIEG